MGLKKNIMMIAFITLLTMGSLQAQNSSIAIKIIGMDEIEGFMSIGIFNNPENFPKKNDKTMGVHLEIKDSCVEYKFEDLTDGEYAIAVYHDENSNSKLDRNFLGIPSEDYVFSNYATGTFGPPSFEDAKFELRDSIKIELDLRGN